MGDRHFLGLTLQASERRAKAPPRTASQGLTLTRLCAAILVFLILTLDVTCAGDGCDWTGSGLDESNSRVVRPLYLRCSQGRIVWRYPRGALRLLLKLSRHSGAVYSAPPLFHPKANEVTPPQRSGLREFRGCIRVSPDFSGARIYLEGHRRLHLLHGGRADPRPLELVRCFASVRGQAALYVEAELDGAKVKNESRKRIASFEYDIQPLGQEVYRDDFQECRPCSEDELLQNYCTSDFVVRGKVNAMYHNEAFERTELTIRTSKVFRDTEPGTFIDTEGQKEKAGPAMSATRYGVLHRPLKCGTKAGHGEFLFMGHLVLGNPKITCAPRLGDWKRIRRKALMDGTNQCGLD